MILEPTPAKAIAHVQNGQRVFIHGSAATPSSLYAALLDRAEELHGLEIVAISTLGPVNWNRPTVRGNVFLKSLFVSANVREWVDNHGGDYVPVFLSEIPALFREGWLPIDVAVLQVSPPDAHGYCSLGTSIDAALTAAKHAKLVIAQINPRMPRTLGDSHIHTSKIHVAIEETRELPEVSYGAEADAQNAIRMFDGFTIHARAMKVSVAKPREERTGPPVRGGAFGAGYAGGRTGHKRRGGNR